MSVDVQDYWIINNHKTSTRRVHFFAASAWKNGAVTQIHSKPNQWCLSHDEPAYLKYLKPGNVKNTNEVLLLVLRVESLVNSSDQPVEHPYVDGFCQRRHSVDDLDNVYDTASQQPYDTEEQWLTTIMALYREITNLSFCNSCQMPIQRRDFNCGILDRCIENNLCYIEFPYAHF